MRCPRCPRSINLKMVLSELLRAGQAWGSQHGETVGESIERQNRRMWRELEMTEKEKEERQRVRMYREN